LALVLAALPLFACDRKVGSVPFSAEGTKTMTLPLAAGRIAFWTDLDLSYEGPATLGYHIELSQAGHTIATADCNPLDNLAVKLPWVETRHGATRASSGHAKMQCGASLPTAGPTLVKATLAFAVQPATATLKHADLVLEQ
jgi:hypothetical protein